ncbi:NADH:flavin oxidoreductase [Paenibacillus sp. ALJ109b]|uniref:NADH:flavin oxidoreductase n=1 Tax=Paenibacillus sp. ALJ109b TaxID=2709068 RepID=UPI0013D2593F|nr:NADH:flavin oxidoreductase [Paenibacillus sp. ALJ109b]NEU63527.1 NADH:flavin oxidoreductase [Paenibacillus sp. ALJ109b]
MSNHQKQQVQLTENLFQPYTIHNLTLQSRIVMPAMGRAFSPDGVPGSDVAAYYRRRAENGVGLIITEGVTIDHPAATSEPRVPRFHGEEALNGWAEVVKQVHEAGGKIFPQLWHMGMARPVGSQPYPEAPSIGPSGIDLEGKLTGAPMTEEEIANIIQAFVDAAVHAKRLGFDGIEIQGAHGYLVDQFFWDRTNTRTDRYGGDLFKRTQFATELIQAIRAAVGPDYPISIRLSQWKMSDYYVKPLDTPDKLELFLKVLVEAGVDIFHCSTRRFWEPEYDGSELGFAGWVKKLTDKPTIAVGSVGLDDEFTSLYTEGKGAGHKDLDDLLHRLEQEEFDLVAVGRALLADPAWAVKIRDGRVNEIQAFSPEALVTLL